MKEHTIFDFILGLGGLAAAIAVVAAIVYLILKKSDEPGTMLIKMAVTVPFVIFCFLFALKLGPAGPFVILFIAVVLSFMWTPHLSAMLVSPLTNLFDGGNERPDDKPFYSIASAKRMRGQYHEAIEETRKQMTRFPNDYEGVMLLASILAENLNDLRGADNVLNHWCEWPKAPEVQVASAWTTMADWHLKQGMDVDAARASLQKIITRFPGTELALRAEQRLAHLVETERLLMAQHDKQAIVVPEGVHNLGLRDSSAFLQPKEIEPGQLAAAHVKHLEAHPHDSEVREKLAVIYAKDFQRLDLATMELLQLINETRHSPKQIAGWLNQLANFELDLGADQETVRSTLEAIVTRFPDLPLAEVTRRRLARLNSEFKGREQSGRGVKLGEYEQNIGLKYGSPRKQG